MAQGFSTETVGVLDGTLIPAAKLDGRVVGGRVRRRRATLDLAALTTKLAAGDTNVLCRIPAGEAFSHGVLTSSVDLGAVATVAIGKAGTAGKYRAAATFRNADTPTLFGPATTIDDAPLAALEDVIMTIAAAALPNVGIVTVDIFTSGR